MSSALGIRDGGWRVESVALGLRILRLDFQGLDSVEGMGADKGAGVLAARTLSSVSFSPDFWPPHPEEVRYRKSESPYGRAGMLR